MIITSEIQSQRKSLSTMKKSKIAVGLPKNKQQVKVFGNFKRHQRSTDQQKVLDPPLTLGSTINSTLTTQISQILEEKGLSVKRSVNLTKQLELDLIYAIVLPFIICDEIKQKQPILMKVDTKNFTESKIDLPFSSFLDSKVNCFKFDVNNLLFRGSFIALGETPLALKICLQKNINENSSWKGLPKMKKIRNQVIQFSHVPLDDVSDVPPFRVLSTSEYEKMFICDLSIIESAQSSLEPNERSANDENSIINSKSVIKDQRSQKSPIKVNDKRNIVRESTIVKKRSESNLDQSFIETTMEKINNQVQELSERSSVLSNLDTTGSILISIINVLDNFRKIIDLKKENEKELSYSVPEIDSTYKLSVKNQIFIEGLIQLDLDLYEAAIKQAKSSNPESFAYALVKFSFPRSYIDDVVLGKKIYDKKDFDEFERAHKLSCIAKYPLSFIWSFPDPYGSRMQGSFDVKIGHERLRAFFNHTFRKSNIFSYSKDAEKKVRRRVMKELCSLNRLSQKRKRSEEEDHTQDDPWENADSHSLNETEEPTDSSIRY